MEYIDKETLRNALFNGEQNLYSWEEIEAKIDAIPAADVAPVRHGKWIVAGDNQPNSFDKFYACSSCRTGRVFKWHQTPYCPNCGAKME